MNKIPFEVLIHSENALINPRKGNECVVRQIN